MALRRMSTGDCDVVQVNCYGRVAKTSPSESLSPSSVEKLPARPAP
jgi:hypothetical protein